ncbi:GNAT family N-acetyltransferase [Candidatus Lokiarchaeum ossiferum]|uniref:GNAT family N-acetyltransferase n=1 Tax=Candidatus Lokiarchaeum ossiferum TaxID=2951803 RepID=UPI00352CFCFC
MVNANDAPNFFLKKPWEKHHSPKYLVTLQNTMGKYLMAENYHEFNEDILKVWFGKDGNISRDVIRFETPEGTLIGYVAITNLSGQLKSHMLFYAILPEYFETSLPQLVIESGISLGESLNLQNLKISTNGTRAAPFDRVLEGMGYHPVKSSLELQLLDFKDFLRSHPPEGITFRKLSEPVDYEQFVEVYNQAFQNSFDFIEWTTENCRKFITFQNHQYDFAIWQASIDDRLIGFCNLSFDPLENVGLVSGFAVLPANQHQGVGSFLLSLAIEHFKEKGCVKIRLNTDVSNENAVKLYTRVGFCVIDSLKIKTYKIF